MSGRKATCPMTIRATATPIPCARCSGSGRILVPHPLGGQRKAFCEPCRGLGQAEHEIKRGGVPLGHLPADVYEARDARDFARSLAPLSDDEAREAIAHYAETGHSSALHTRRLVEAMGGAA